MDTQLIQSEKGFVTTMLLALLPLILATGIGLAFSSKVLLHWHHTHKICRNEAMSLQKNLGELLKSLMLLNPQAHKLRADKIIATAKLAAAVAAANPPVIAFYTAKIGRIHTQQIKLDRQQKLILSMAKAQMLKWQIRMTTKFQLKTLGPMRLEHSFQHDLAVEPWPKSGLAPAYNLKNNFEQEQIVGAKWFSSLNRLLPHSMQPFLKSNRTLAGECFATLKQRRLTWKPALSEAKSFLK